MLRSVDFETVYRDHFGRACTCLRRLGVPARAVEDVAQDVFIVVHRRLHEYDPARPLFRWLYGIIWRCAADHRQLASTRREHLDEETSWERPNPQPSPEERIGAHEDEERLAVALAELPAKLRDLLILHDLEGFSTGEAARILRLTEDQVSGRLRQAQGKLKNLLQTLGGSKKPPPLPVATLLRKRRGFLHAVSCLSSPLRDVLVLVDIEGMDRSEAARTLQLPARSIDEHLDRARLEVANRLARSAEASGGSARPTDADRRRAFLRALEALPLPLRDVIVLHDIEGLSTTDVAEIVSRKDAEVAVDLAEARRALTAALRGMSRPGGDS